jgi:hypothetical protein
MHCYANDRESYDWFSRIESNYWKYCFSILFETGAIFLIKLSHKDK